MQKLAALSSQDSNYRLSIEELMKFHYARAEWSKFFAYAQYYRKNFSPDSQSRVALLEPLALLRHCQYEILMPLVSSMRKKHPRWSQELDQVMALANTRFDGKATSSPEGGALKLHAEGRTLWKTDADIIDRKRDKIHPRHISIKVANKCD